MAAAERHQYLSAVADVAVQARRAPGCLDFVQSADPIEPDRINVYERWDSDEALISFRTSGGALDRSLELTDSRLIRRRGHAMVTEDEKPSGDAATGQAGVSLKIDVEKDTLTPQNDTIGLAQSVVARTLLAAADDIADIVVKATNESAVELLVTTAPGFRSDADLALAVQLEVEELSARLDAVPPVAAPRTGQGRREAFAVAGLAAGLLQVLPSAAGTLTKLFAHQYTTAGSALEAVAAGVDLRVAGAVRAKLPSGSAMSVRVERLFTPSASPLLSAVRALVERYDDLHAALGAARETARTSKAALDAAMAAKTSAQSQLVELSKGLAADKAVETNSPWSTAWRYAIERAEGDVTALAEQLDRATTQVARLEALNSALETFLGNVLAADGSGGIPLTAAMRGEWLRAAAPPVRRMILYVHALHGGVDQVLDTKLGHDKRAVLAGSSVEFALVGADGAIAASGVRDNLWGGVMRLDRITDFRGSSVDSVFEPNVRRTEPPP